MLKLQSHTTDQSSYEAEELQKALDQVFNNKNIGFLDLPFKDQFYLDSKKYGAQMKKDYDHLVVIGIGGSSMGPRAFAEISDRADQITFFDNPDTMLAANILKRIRSGEKLAWLFISKSGSTIEVLWAIEWVYEQYKKLNKNFWDHTYYITELVKNPLFDLAEKHQRPCLEIPLNVGGRYSVLSPVGLLVAEYLDLKLDKIRSGAKMALQDQKNILTLVDQYLQSFNRNENISLFWFYSSYMRWFGGWIQQLWAESLGKKVDRAGEPAFAFSTPMAAIGTYDQHSILQQVIEGPKDKFVSLFRFKSVEEGLDLNKMTYHPSEEYNIVSNHLFAETQMLSNKKFGDLIKAEALATQKGLQSSGVSTLSFELAKLDEESVAYLFMLFQLVVATLAEVKNVDAFNQPGVQLGKTLIREML